MAILTLITLSLPLILEFSYFSLILAPKSSQVQFIAKVIPMSTETACFAHNITLFTDDVREVSLLCVGVSLEASYAKLKWYRENSLAIILCPPHVLQRLMC